MAQTGRIQESNLYRDIIIYFAGFGKTGGSVENVEIEGVTGNTPGCNGIEVWEMDCIRGHRGRFFYPNFPVLLDRYWIGRIVEQGRIDDMMAVTLRETCIYMTGWIEVPERIRAHQCTELPAGDMVIPVRDEGMDRQSPESGSLTNF